MPWDSVNSLPLKKGVYAYQIKEKLYIVILNFDNNLEMNK